MSLIVGLEHLIDAIELRGTQLRPLVKPGLSRAAIEQILLPLGFVPPPELIELYRWHNGMERNYSEIMMFGEHDFIPLENAVADYDEIVKNYIYAEHQIDLSLCLPVAADPPSSIAMYCSDAPFDGLMHPMVGIFGHIWIAFEDLETMVRTSIAWFEEGIYDQSTIDQDRQKSIWRRLNPRIQERDTTL